MFLFSFTNSGHTNYLLGSKHEVPLSHLPEKVQALIQSKKTLVAEHASVQWKGISQEWGLVKDDTEDTTNITCALDIIKPNLTLATEINPFPEAIEQLVSSTTQEFFGVAVPQLSLKGLMAIASIISHKEGMDCNLTKKYIEDGKIVYYLEDTGIISTSLDSRNALSIFCTLGNLLQPHDHNNDTSYHNGILTKHNISEIIEGSTVQLSIRNEKWLSGNQGPEYFNIHQLHEQIDDSLFMTGFYHLFGESGILNSLLHNGYNVERLDDDLNAVTLTEEMLHAYTTIIGDSNS